MGGAPSRNTETVAIVNKKHNDTTEGYTTLAILATECMINELKSTSDDTLSSSLTIIFVTGCKDNSWYEDVAIKENV